MKFTHSLAVALALTTCMGAWAAAADKPAPASADDVEFFEKTIRPLLADNCLHCHGPTKQEGDLRLDSRAAMLKGNDDGPVIKPGDPEASWLIKAVRRWGDVKMPPDQELPQAGRDALAAWIKRGAPWPEKSPAKEAAASIDVAHRHWAFQPVRRAEPPAVDNEKWCQTPVDRFILARMTAAGLSPAKSADRRTLIRRASFDLIGLPPSPAEVEQFVGDAAPDAYPRLVDRLLASPHYGERWGRYWLDVARYADTKGYVGEEDRSYAYAYTYRDWVIRSLNDDLPYDQFVVSQLAADLAPHADDQPLAALGFLTLGRRFINNKHDIIDDRIDVITRGLQGLTVACARCHDHKFDPIPQQDYYSLYGVLDSCVEKLIPLEPPAQSFLDERKERERKIAELQQTSLAPLLVELRGRIGDYLLAAEAQRKQLASADYHQIAVKHELNAPVVTRWRKRLEAADKAFDPVLAPWLALAKSKSHDFGPADVKAAFAGDANPAHKLNPRIATLLDAQPPKSLAELAQRYNTAFVEVEADWQKSLAAAREAKMAEPTSLPDADAEQLRQVYSAPGAPLDLPVGAAEDYVEKPVRAKIHKLQNELAKYNRSDAAPRQTLVLNDAPQPASPHVFLRGNPNKPGPAVPRRWLALLEPADRQPFGKDSGRLEIAHKIANKDNPLTARVLVNRVWQHHFGVGLVRTPSDFGAPSIPPSDPELLDYLAARFMDEGWSLKKLQRWIMLSSTYQQASDNPREVECRRADPENTLLWKMNRQRLDFEALHDALLAVGGNLDLKLLGPSIELTAEPTIPRRAVYGYIDRQNLPGLLRTFDFAGPDAHSPQRFVTTIPQQALYLLNSSLAIDQARHLAKRSEAGGSKTGEGADTAARLQRLYMIALGRPPRGEEYTLAATFLDEAPPAAGTDQLSPWERLAQVLLMSNEFVFGD